MIKAGDRIVQRFADADPFISGIVAQAISCDWGDWLVVVWDGAHGREREYQIACISEMAVDIVERRCKFKELPEVIRDSFQKFVDQSKPIAHEKYISDVKKLTDFQRQSARKFGMPALASELARDFLAKHTPEDVIKSKEVIISILIEGVSKKFANARDRIGFAQGMLMVFWELFEDALRAQSA